MILKLRVFYVCVYKTNFSASKSVPKVVFIAYINCIYTCYSKIVNFISVNSISKRKKKPPKLNLKN